MSDLDVLVTRCGGAALLLENEGGNRRASLSLLLVGRTSNRDGIGTRALIRSGEGTAMREVKSGMSYLSQGTLELHFGLGDQPSAESIEIRWPNGQSETVQKIGVNQVVTVTEGKGVTSSVAMKR